MVSPGFNITTLDGVFGVCMADISVNEGMIKTPSPLSGKAKMLVPTSSPGLKPSTKRRVTPSFDDFDGQNDDAENVNPNMFLSPMKRTKLDLPSTSLKPKGLSTLPSSFNFTFNPTKTTPTTSMPPPANIPSRLSTPMKYAGVTKLSSRTPLTAPAGRSPKSKRDKGRRLSAHTPTTRIDHSTLSRSSARNGLPFSIDAALTASLKTPAPIAATLPKPAPSVEESMPSSWFFAIHEDTAEEEAENLMEHSTLTLDLSSDDEAATKVNEDRGKENVAPADYDAVVSSSPRSSRRSLKSAADMEIDEAARAPLGSLDTTEFIPDGLTKDSIIIINELPETCTLEAPIEKQELLCNPPIVISPPKKTCTADLKDDIFIFEDESASPALSTGGKRKRSADDDEDA